MPLFHRGHPALSQDRTSERRPGQSAGILSPFPIACTGQTSIPCNHWEPRIVPHQIDGQFPPVSAFPKIGEGGYTPFLLDDGTRKLSEIGAIEEPEENPFSFAFRASSHAFETECNSSDRVAASSLGNTAKA